MASRTNKKVFVGMSGGVDSSVAALLLKERGYHVIGVFLRCYNIDGCAEQDAEDARRVAGHLGIPFYVWDFEEEYKKKVVEYVVDGYRRGLTPNPDVECNREIKFGLFFDRARKLGADFVATGHYVRLVVSSGVVSRKTNLQPTNYKLLTAQDTNKDQSYFLWTLTARQLAHCLFPIGDYKKPEVRELAKRAGLPTAGKKDSQGICFLGQVNMIDFLREYIPARKGEIVTVDGHPIGVHSGAQFYTIGQRHLGAGYRLPVAGGRKDAQPFYVTAKDVKKNTLTVAEGDDHPALYRKEIMLRSVNFLNPSYAQVLKNIGIRVSARVRYRQPLSAALLRVRDVRLVRGSHRTANKQSVRAFELIFEHPQKFVAPGQSAVFYVPRRNGAKAGAKNSIEMLGGGIII